MTIINPVISVGGGGGDMVSAYALGTAVNAVEGDKVLLNYSADILTREESVSVQGIYETKAYHLTPVQKGIFLRYSSSMAYFYKKDITKGWVKASEYQYETLYPFVAIGEKGFVSTGWKSFKPFAIDELGAITSLSNYDSSGYVYLNELSCSDDSNVILQPKTNYSDAPMSVYRFVNGKYVYNTLPRKTSGYLMYILPGGDGRYYPVADASTNKIWKYDITTNTFVEEIGTGNGKFGGVSYKGFRITIGSWSTSSGTEGGVPIVRNLSWDGTTWTTTTNSQLTNQLCSVLGGVSGRFICVRKWKDELVFTAYPGDKNIRIRYNEDKGVFEESLSPFADKSNPYSVIYGDRDAAVYVSSSTKCILRNVGVPPEESYVAIQPNVRDQIAPSTTLTGFVKENDNGILSVSTVVDPNAVVPTPPDEYGLKTTVNYGGNVIVEPNGTVVGASVSDEGVLTTTSVSSNIGMYFDSPIYNKAYNSFEIVVPFKSTYTSTQHLIDFDTDALMVYSNNYNKLYLRTRTVSDSSLTDTAANGIDLSTKTWLKLSYSSSVGYTLSYSKDGSIWTTAVTVSKTGVPASIRQITNFTNNVANIYLADAYMVVDGVRVWEGTKSRIDFGSVDVSYGYFRNTLTKPSDKYIEYTGGVLGRDDILSFGGYTLTPAVYRNADLGNWTSETEAALLGVGAQITGVVKRIDTPVYLWHDLSYITPAEPETVEPVVDLDANTISLPVSWKTLGGVVYEYPDGFPTTQATELEEKGQEALNVTVIGEPYIDGTTVENFSDINMLSFPVPEELTVPTSEDFEIVTCFRLDAISGEEYILYNDKFSLKTLVNANIRAVLYSADNIYAGNGIEVASIVGQKMWIKWVSSSTTGETFSYSTDGEAYVAYKNFSKFSSGLTAGDILLGNRGEGEGNNIIGGIYLDECYIKVGGELVWTGSKSEGGATLPGANNLYATKTGDSCGLAISSTSPTGVDSSAVLGTVELDADGVITSYTPGE